MQKNICAICLQSVKVNTDILQQNNDLKCVHYSCLNRCQVGQRILAQTSCQNQSDDQNTQNNTSVNIFTLTKRRGFRQLPPCKRNSTPGHTSTDCNKRLYPVQEYSVNKEIYSRTLKKFSKTSNSSGTTKWFSSMRKQSYRMMPLFTRKRHHLRKSQRIIQPKNKQEEDTTGFPFTINASEVYSSEILDLLATQNINELPNPLPEKPIPQHALNRQHKKKVTIQETRESLTERRNHDYRKPLQRRALHKRKFMPTISIGSQYSNHSRKLNAADFMDWVTSAPKIPNGNMLIILDCRNKKDTKNIGIQPSFNGTARKTAESLILDLLDGRKTNDRYYEYYTTCQSKGSRVTLVKARAAESPITTSLKEQDNFYELSVKEEPRFIYPETVEEKMHHVVTTVCNGLGHFSSFVGRLTKAMKEEFSYSNKNINVDKKLNV